MIAIEIRADGVLVDRHPPGMDEQDISDLLEPQRLTASR